MTSPTSRDPRSRASAPRPTAPSTSWSVFHELATRYDAWYDSPRGRALFEAELRCLAPWLDATATPRLEVGVGSGRFAERLRIDVGLDPAMAPLELAARRGLSVVCGAGEHLPFADHQFGAVVVVVTLCFAGDPSALLAEARRVLVPGGLVVLGIVPAESAWARRYAELGRAGHPFYRGARFLSLCELRDLLEVSGLAVVGARSTLVGSPDDPLIDPTVRDGIDAAAGFVSIAARDEGPAERS